MAGSATPTTKTPTKVQQVQAMLKARRGTTLSALCEATGWQKHSVRAALSGLRKKGVTIERQPPAKPGDEARYRIIATRGSAE
ncbi:DUF3489 domain-containing protein [Limibaculum sp. FT325]|uniref:DUF3489 domain-containing protein n=1 Tax=Thermohalobaculum sediminis TaxID=2939436 RepID=UPI0020C0AF53|nr:DUF3489 domain-containing protein [Limibaculum sediminis]MCL5778862.1 DUF3489 domain-containing protein [Limibaculum sediminis]